MMHYSKSNSSEFSRNFEAKALEFREYTFPVYPRGQHQTHSFPVIHTGVEN